MEDIKVAGTQNSLSQTDQTMCLKTFQNYSLQIFLNQQK